MQLSKLSTKRLTSHAIMEDLIIISEGKYPNGSAGALRQHSLAKLFLECGFTPFVISLGKSTDFQPEEFDGVRYVSLRNKKNTFINRIFNIALFTMRIGSYIKKNNSLNKILVVKVPIISLLYLKRYAKQNNVQLIHDSVEWYSPEEFVLKWFSPEYIKNNLYNKILIDKSFKVVSISTFLHEHYSKRGIVSYRIPVILDVLNMDCEKNTKGEKLVLLYAGAVGRKDHLKDILSGLAKLNNEQLSSVEFRIFGVSEKDVKKMLNNSENYYTLISNIKCYGRVPREVVLRNLKEADFTVLLRSAEKRYAKAGFPTKVVESLASATPVILNISSDLNNYLNNGRDSIFVKDSTPNAFCEAIEYALNLSYEKKKWMQAQARITAENYFDYRKYEDIIKLI